MFFAPVNWRFRSGDRFEFNVEPDRRAAGRAVRGRRRRRRSRPARTTGAGTGSKSGTAQKRRLYTQVTWWFGGFYDGDLDQIEWTGAWNPTPLVTVEFTGERNVGRLPSGRLHADAGRQPPARQRLAGPVGRQLRAVRHRQRFGRRRTRGCAGRSARSADLFVVYNHNVRSLLDRWQLESNQLLVKLQYAWRM